MSEQYKPNIGLTPEDGARRDAIHIAVAPVVAGEDLGIGNPVWLDKEDGQGYAEPASFKNGVSEGRSPVGLVDPFLTYSVQKGDRFWLFLYPNTITNLRHVWEHPAFKVKLPPKKE